MKKKYDVVGMTCSACSTHVDKAVRGLDGVDDVNVNLLQNSMTVEFDENKLSESQIFEAVDKAGYKAQNIGEKQVSNVQEDENEHKKKNRQEKNIYMPFNCFINNMCDFNRKLYS